MGGTGEKYFLSLRHRIFSVPRWEFTVAMYFLLVIFVSFILSWDWTLTFLLFVIPYTLANLLDIVFVRASSIYFPSRRILALNTIVFFFAVIQMAVLMFFLPFHQSLFLSFSWVIGLRLLVWFVFMNRRHGLKVLATVDYSVIYFLLTLLFYPQFSIPFLVASVVYSLGALALLKMSVKPFIREFGEDPLWFLASFVDYLSGSKENAVEDMNRFFYKIYRERKVPVSTMVFWRKNGEPKLLMVFPYIHPGPFGNVGGSNITEKLSRMTGLDNLMVFHTTSTHDDNVADDRDVERIAQAVKESLGRGKRYDRCGDFRRSRVDGFQVISQSFGPYALVGLVPDEFIFDDVDINVGLLLRKEGKGKFKDMAVVDAHNKFDENALPLRLTSKGVYGILNLLENMESRYPLRVGFGAHMCNRRDIGPHGIRVALVDCGGRRTAYVLIDGNNIEKGLRDRIRRELLKMVDEVEVFSTDNHIVNYDTLDLNPIGEKGDWDCIVDASIKALKDAMEDLEDVSVSMVTRWITLKMARRGQLKRMSDIARDTLRALRISVPLVSALSFLGALLAFLYL